MEIKYEDISNDYFNSDLYQLLDPNESGPIEVKHYIYPLVLRDEKEVLEFVKLTMYWCFVDLPETIRKFNLEQGYKLLKELIKHIDDEDVIKFIKKHMINYIEFDKADIQILLINELYPALQQHKGLQSTIYNNVKLEVVNNFSLSVNFFIGVNDILSSSVNWFITFNSKKMKQDIKYTSLYLDFITDPFIKYYSREGYEISSSDIIYNHSWRLNPTLEIAHPNKLILEMLENINVNFIPKKRFNKFIDYVRKWFPSVNPSDKLTIYEYYLIALQLSHRYVLNDITGLIEIISYFEHNCNIQLTFKQIFRMFPVDASNLGSSKYEDLTGYAKVLGRIIAILFQIDKDYYLELMNDYIKWNDIKPHYWEETTNMYEYIKYECEEGLKVVAV